MSRSRRRFEVMLPIRFNDGRPVPRKWLGKALRELTEQFGGGNYQADPFEGEWRHEGIIYHDKSVKFIVDVPDSSANRQWMRGFKARWKDRLQQLEIWMVSYRIEIE